MNLTVLFLRSNGSFGGCSVWGLPEGLHAAVLTATVRVLATTFLPRSHPVLSSLRSSASCNRSKVHVCDAQKGPNSKRQSSE